MRHKHIGCSSVVYTQEVYYNPTFIFWGEPDIVGGFLPKSIGVTWCDICGRLLRLNNRKATLWERISWRLAGGRNGEWWSRRYHLPSN